MKTPLSLLFISSIFLYGSHVSAQQTVRLSNPDYQSRNTESFEISEIVLSDTATILHIDTYLSPNSWMRFPSKASLVGATTGKSYKLIRPESFARGRFVPASGNVSFTLQFEPVSSKDQQITFRETNLDFQMEGIRLTKDSTRHKIHTRLTGEVIDRPQSSRLMLQPHSQNAMSPFWISIPIRNGKFEYDLYTDTQQAYLLTFWDEYQNTSMHIATFFSESGAVHITCFPFESEEPFKIQTEAPITKELQAFTRTKGELFDTKKLQMEMHTLYKTGRYQSEASKALWQKIEATEDPTEREKLLGESNRMRDSGEGYSDEAKEVLAKIKKQDEDAYAWELDYFKQHPTLVSFYRLARSTEALIQKKENCQSRLALFKEVFAPKYPDHPYTKQMLLLIENMKTKIGNQHIE